MANRAAGVSVIGSVVHLGVVEWGLQHSGREVDVIHCRVVVGVHSRRCHSPFGMIDRLPDLVDATSRLEQVCVAYIADEVFCSNPHGTVIAPLIGISDFIAHALEFQHGLLLRFRTHPVELLNALSHRVFDAANHV